MSAADWFNLLGGNVYHVIDKLVGSIVTGIVIVNFLNPRNWK